MGVRCMWMRGGTSKGAFFLASDLPAAPAERDALLLRIFGSPDARQIDGIGGAHPLTSKVAVVETSTSGQTDVDYLFLQVAVEGASVTDRQNCGNLLAGVGAFAIERGLIATSTPTTKIRIRMRNSGGIAEATIQTPGRRVQYSGTTAISGVPGTGAAVILNFADTAGSSCGTLLPTGNVVDEIAGIPVTCLDNGMPVVVLCASDLGLKGDESPALLEANVDLRTKLEEIRHAAGTMMGLGDVGGLTVPKLSIVSPPRVGGNVCTRTFIPHRCHEAIGVLGAVSVATSCLIAGTRGAEVARVEDPTAPFSCEHPTGSLEVVIELFETRNGEPTVRNAGVVRTTRKLFDGTVFARD